MRRYQPTAETLAREADALARLLARALERLDQRGVHGSRGEETSAGLCYEHPVPV